MIMTGTVAMAVTKEKMDTGWRFHEGDNIEASATDFNDSDWRQIDLPHDWSVETEAAAQAGDNVGPFSKNSVGKDATGFTVGGIAWYRKTFNASRQSSTECFSLYFEGVYNYAEVWLNGRKLYFNRYGYVPFRIDITPFMTEGKNVLAVR